MLHCHRDCESIYGVYFIVASHNIFSLYFRYAPPLPSLQHVPPSRSLHASDPSKKELLTMARGSSDESYDPKATFGPHSGSCTPPEDWDCEGSSYNPTLVQIQSQWNEFLAFASEIPTRSGDPAVFIHPWLPWYAPVLTTILVLWLHFCPSSLENALGGRSPAGATFNDSTTTLVSSTWQLIHLAIPVDMDRHCIRSARSSPR